MESNKSKEDKRKSSKKRQRPCPFCSKHITQFSKHIRDKHKNESVVKEINSTESKLDRKKKLRMLLVKGIEQYNETVMGSEK